MKNILYIQPVMPSEAIKFNGTWSNEESDWLGVYNNFHDSGDPKTNKLGIYPHGQRPDGNISVPNYFILARCGYYITKGQDGINVYPPEEFLRKFNISL